MIMQVQGIKTELDHHPNIILMCDDLLDLEQDNHIHMYASPRHKT